MRLSSDDIIEIIKKETLNLAESTLEDLSDLDELTKMLTVMDKDTREKFTIQGSGDDVVTLKPSSGEEPFDVQKKEFSKKYILPKDAAEEDDKLHGDKYKNETEQIDLSSLVREAMGLK